MKGWKMPKDPNDPMQQEVEYKFTKRHPTDKIWRVHAMIGDEEIIGKILFSFDKKKIYNVYGDYPNNMTKREQEIFEEEYPEWVEWLEGRR